MFTNSIIAIFGLQNQMKMIHVHNAQPSVLTGL